MFFGHNKFPGYTGGPTIDKDQCVILTKFWLLYLAE